VPSTLPILRQRRDRRQRARRSAEGRLQRAGLGLGSILGVLLALAILAAAVAYADLTRDLPPVEMLPILLNPQDGLLLQPTRLYDRSGRRLLLALAPQDGPRGYIPYDQIPSSLVDATLALADPGFWEHPGYVLDGWQDPGLHPTLAQRLVSDLLLWDEAPSTRRAIRERLLAAQLTARYGREQALEWYLNSAGYGRYAYGVEQAAQFYLGKSAADLNLSESTLLAAVSQAPALNPLDAPAAAEERRQAALETMLAQGMIPEIPPMAAPVITASASGDMAGIAPAFTSLALAQLGGVFDRDRIARGGLVIRTTLDLDLQTQAACLVQAWTLQLSGGTGDPACEAALPPLPSGLALLDLSAGALILDPVSGQALAAVGETRNGQETAALTTHPAGSLWTPFIYLSGFTRGLSPASLGWDIPGSTLNLGGEYQGPVRLRTALANDYLPPAARLLEQVGLDNVRRTVESFGSSLPQDYSLLTGDLTLLEAAQAYGVLAAGGVMNGQALSDTAFQPVTALEVTATDHAAWLDWETPQTRLVVSSQLAYLMNHVLGDEAARWPSLGHPNLLEIGRPAGAKLGQTGDGLDAWAVGYTPRRVVAVWLGGGQEAFPAALAAGLWRGLMQAAVQGQPLDGWQMPPGVSLLEVCDPSGLLPTEACPNVVNEVFLDGNAPTQADTLYQAFEINRETGFLATVFTPPELVEARVYMVVPPEAEGWAESVGLARPPSAYDSIQAPPPEPLVHITTPALFAQVGGRVEVHGTAAGDGFAWYRLEYGQGLNPQDWVQIGEDTRQAVSEGLLGTWDTTALDGLYALRLLLVRTDLRVERAVILVTVGE